ncbi:MAG: PAS domain S-box protein [Myxococcota bacterium]
MSEPLERLLGRKPGQPPWSFEAFLERVAPLDRERLARFRHLEPRESIEVPFHFDAGSSRRVLVLRGSLRRDPSTGHRILSGLVHVQASDAPDGLSLELAVETAKLGVWRLETASGHLHWNDRLLEIYGLSRRAFEANLDGWRAQIHPDDAAEAHAQLERVFEGESVYDVHFRIRRPSGEVRHIKASAAPVYRDGELVELLGINIDVTDLRDAESALQTREGMYQRLVEASQAAILVANDRGNYTTANAAAADLFGLSVDQLLAMNVADLGLEGLDNVPERYRSFVERGVEAGEFSFPHPDGSRHFATYRAVRIAPDVNLSVLMDITEQRRAEAHLRSSQRLEAIGRLAGGVAHNFNNLLTVIKGAASLAREDVPRVSPVADALRDIEHATQRATTLVSQLMAFGRTQPARPSWVDVNGVVDVVRSMLGRVIGEGIVLETDLWSAAPPVWIDEGQLAQVVMNLAINACDAMPDGGRLRIRTGDAATASPGAWEGVAEPPDDFLVLTVEDTGAGVPVEVRPHLFEPFFSTKQPAINAGLGLATVYGVVRRYGGTITMHSRQGSGSRFEVVLRVDRPPSAEPPVHVREAATEPEPSADATVLVVEDQPELRAMVVRILERRGFRVVSADHGLSGWAAVQERGGSFDLVLTDLIMPHMSGKTLGERLMRAYPALPVLYMSGYADTVEAPPSGKVIRKPFRPRDLLQAVTKALA